MARKNLATYTHSHTAIIVKGGRIIIIANNRYENGMHAEVSAIMKARKIDIRGAEMYVCRALRARPCGNSKPCEDCENTCREFGISKVYYTTDNMNQMYQEMRL
jgi:pyrimidine deaminase RibD-like protein